MIIDSRLLHWSVGWDFDNLARVLLFALHMVAVLYCNIPIPYVDSYRGLGSQLGDLVIFCLPVYVDCS